MVACGPNGESAGGGATAGSGGGGGGGAGGGGAGGAVCSTTEHGDALVELAHPECLDEPCGVTEVLSVEVAGDAFYACTGQRGLHVGSVANSGLDYQASLAVRCQDLAVDGARVLLSNHGDALAPVPQITLLDFSDPPVPQVVGVVDLTGHSPEDVVLVAPGLFAVAMHDEGVWFYSADEAGALTLEAQVGGLDNAVAMTKSGDRLYAADRTSGVRVIDVHDPDAPALVGHVPLDGGTVDIAVSDGLLFAAAGAAGVRVLDLASPDTPTLITTIDTPGAAVDVAARDGFLYVADWNDLRVFDVHAPSAPSLLGAEEVATQLDFARVLAVDVAGDVAFVGDWSGMFRYRVTPCLTAPDVRTTRLPVRFEHTAPGEVAAYSLVVANEGAEELSIGSITTEGPFKSLATALTIPPGKKDFIEIRLEPTSSAPAEGRLLLSTNDPDEAEIAIDLTGNVTYLGVGDAVPDWTWFSINGFDEIGTAALAGDVIVLSYFATF
jgi:hypothetical protein